MRRITRLLFITAIVATASLFVAPVALAQDWSVSRSNGQFVVTRSSGSGPATVMYRTVGISALSGKHFNGVRGILSFEDGETSKGVTVTHYLFADLPLRYKYQGTRTFYYDFEVLDQDGNMLADMRNSMSSGGDNNNQYYLNNYYDFVNKESISRLAYMNGSSTVSCFVSKYHDEGYTPPSSDVESSGTYEGYALIDDEWDYTRKAATIGPSYLFAVNRAGGSGEWHKLIGNKLYASVYFTEKEKNDGYAYVHILIGDANTAYDTGADPNGGVNTPVKSIYKACFELQKGSDVYSGSGKWIFPHSSDAHQKSEETGSYSAFPLSTSYLWEQKFRDESYRAGDNNNAFILDPDISALTVRFDCGGKDNDTYGYKDVKVRWALLDATAPSVLKSDITVSSGPHYNGNDVTINVPFSEPVTIERQSRYILHTSWGNFDADYDGSGSNVVSFTGTITADPGTTLTINSLEIKYNDKEGYSPNTVNIPIRDLMENDFTGSVYKSLSVSVDEPYTISYDLGGGSTPLANLTKYTGTVGPINLCNPTREYFDFTGWTGTGLASPTMTVTIPYGSTGNRSYTATWQLNTGGLWTGDGSLANPYVISTAEGLDLLATLVNAGINFSGEYFQLGG